MVRYISLLLFIGLAWGQDCDDGYVWIDEIPDFVETDYYCFYQEDLDVLQSIIDSNENLFGQYPFQTGSQIWENGRLSTLEFYWYNQLTILPDNFGNLSSLKTLWLFFNQLTSLPESIGNLSSLENFELSWSQITDIPESIGNLSSLKYLTLTSNPLTSVPESIGYLTNLEGIYLQSNQLTNIPESISNLSSLQSLHISDNQLIGIPENIGNLSNLETLHLSGNQITNIPESIGNLLNLQILYLHSNQLLIVPESICNLNLEWSNQNHFNIHVNQICPPYPECIEDYMGFQDTTNCGQVSIIDETFPVTYNLYNAYPNPFNPITTLRYELPEDAIVNITIYDMMGRQVKTLVNGSQTAGYRTIQWNATNDEDKPVSAGLYLYTIQAGKFRQAKKMVVLK